MAELQLPKLATRVRFPSPAPFLTGFPPVFLFRAWEPLFEFGRLFAYAQNSPFLSETCLRFLPPYSVGAWRVSLHPLQTRTLSGSFFLLFVREPLFEFGRLLLFFLNYYCKITLFLYEIGYNR